mmetsp:Transcript_7059/g.11594  ORF Transcript_7059/g.11594 Transcript_7059/m.11594 type:complete len:163 (+) Transcript_7059:359-847(+)
MKLASTAHKPVNYLDQPHLLPPQRQQQQQQNQQQSLPPSLEKRPALATLLPVRPSDSDAAASIGSNVADRKHSSSSLASLQATSDRIASAVPVIPKFLMQPDGVGLQSHMRTESGEAVTSGPVLVLDAEKEKKRAKLEKIIRGEEQMVEEEDDESAGGVGLG